ncbi:MAG: hypothetical protein LBN07_00680 [Christensenellaceae bacterium]|jgi:hypothetical protein|nr:hypothetical protein [Christensenellaceae bacterium]
MDSEEILDSAREYFLDNLEEINEYLNSNKAKDIKQKYKCYLSADEEEDDDE